MRGERDPESRACGDLWRQHQSAERPGAAQYRAVSVLLSKVATCDLRYGTGAC